MQTNIVNAIESIFFENFVIRVIAEVPRVSAGRAVTRLIRAGYNNRPAMRGFRLASQVATAADRGNIWYLRLTQP